MGQSFFWKSRHTTLAVLFGTWLVSYADRMVMATAIPYIATDFNLTPVAMGVVMSAFFVGYATCQLPGGFLADKFGARKVMFGAILIWSLFTVFTGLAGSLASMLWIRVVFGIGEGVFPAASFKSLSNWFPKKERGTATGIMMASNPLGAAIAPLIVAGMVAAWGWRSAFIGLLLPGLVLCYLIWRLVPDRPADKKGISREELAEIQDEPALEQTGEVAKVSFWEVVKVPTVTKCFFMLFFFNTAAWGFVSWLPSYLVKVRGFEILKMGITASLPFFVGTIGFALGGWLNDKFRHNPKIPLLTCQLSCSLFLYLMYTAESTNLLILYQTLAGGFLYTAGGVIFALPMSSIPSGITGRAMGFINTAGQGAGFFSPIIMGYLVQTSGGSFNIAFAFLIVTMLTSAVIATTIKSRKAAISTQ
ncbi:MAG TPA: MFS transporter [Patescibacteria group bacterium]|nr:MFS transporter [Patescibacteria group bacterium]